MTSDRALEILSEATRRINADRDLHQLWVEAINVLARAISPSPSKNVEEPIVGK